MINEHATHFAGLPVVEWDPQTGLPDPTGRIYRITLTHEEAVGAPPRPAPHAEPQSLLDRARALLGAAGGRRAPRGPRLSWADKFARFLEGPAAPQVIGIVVGDWTATVVGHVGAEPIIAALVAARDRLPNLKALFLGDLIREECEISWIQQSDVSPLLAAYPHLEHLCLRGADGLTFGTLRHEHLKLLIVQSGGLPGQVVREIAAAHLPELEHLELWLGEENYGGDATLKDLAPLLTGERFPKLRTLGLRDSEKADEIAVAVATAPVLERLRVLDLSLGTLGDEGAAALLGSPAVARLEKLDIHHHFCSEEMVARLQRLGIPVDASERLEPEGRRGDRHRYVAVSE
jgi:hypothetical protein